MATLLVLFSCGQEGPFVGGSATEDLTGSVFRPALGRGVDFAETKTYGECVTGSDAYEEHPGMDHTLYKELSVRDRAQLNSALSISAAMSAKTLWGDGGASGSSFHDMQMSSDAFYWLVHAEYKLNVRGLRLGRLQLTDAAKEILRGPNGLHHFHKACGDYFYSDSQDTATYALLYEFRSAEEKTMQKIKAAAAYEGFGVKGGAAFQQIAEAAKRSSTLRIHVDSTGGSDRLRSYATNPAELEEELTKLRQDLYQHHTGATTIWNMTDYNIFPEVVAAQELATKEPTRERLRQRAKDQALTKLYAQYTKNVDADLRIRSRLDLAALEEPMLGYSAQKKERLYDLLALIDKNNVEIASRAQDCIYAEVPEDCATDAIVSRPPWGSESLASLLSPDEDFTTLQGWTLMSLPRDGSKIHVDFYGKSPGGLHRTEFRTGDKLVASVVGLIAGNDQGVDQEVVIGNEEMVRDPVDGQRRVNACVYEFADVCSLRIIPTRGAGAGQSVVVHKLQLVLFDSNGFVRRKIDFPPID